MSFPQRTPIVTCTYRAITFYQRFGSTQKTHHHLFSWFGKASLTSNHNHFQPLKQRRCHSDVDVFETLKYFNSI